MRQDGQAIIKKDSITSQKTRTYLTIECVTALGKRSAHREKSQTSPCLGIASHCAGPMFHEHWLRKAEGGYNWVRKRGSRLLILGLMGHRFATADC